MKIVIFSNICIDHNINNTASYTAAGSPAMFFVRIYKQFPDVEATIISSYGKDYLNYLTNVTILPKEPTSDKTLIYTNDTRGIKRKQEALNRDFSIPPEITDDVIETLKNADAIIFAPLLPNYSIEYITKVFKYAKGNCIKILSPQGYFRSFTKDNRIVPRVFIEAKGIIPLFNFVIMSNEDYPHVEELATRWIDNGTTEIIITLAEKGALLIDSIGSQSIPTTPVTDIVNSVGAGDIFTASFVYNYFKNRDVIESIRFGHKIAGTCLNFTPDTLSLAHLLV